MSDQLNSIQVDTGGLSNSPTLQCENAVCAAVKVLADGTEVCAAIKCMDDE